MIIDRTWFGDLLVEVRYDSSIAMFTGAVVNAPYPVVFMAPTVDALHAKIRRLVTGYLGKAA